MQIDCRNLACPQPVLDTKKALQSLKDGENLSILLNSISSKENVLRFLQSQNLAPKLTEKGGEFEISVLNKITNSQNCENVCEKILFLKSDKVGNGELGEKLMVGFCTALKELKISKIICVNEAVLISTNEAHKAFGALKELENLGVEIINCGTCLEFFEKTNSVKIGRIGNAFEILSLLFGENKVLSL